jgi:hypothetical protein
MDVSKCANAHDAYLEGTNYAVTQLNLDNVAMYLDAGKHLSMMLDDDKNAHSNPSGNITNQWHRTCRMAWLACQLEPSGPALRECLHHCI